ncbi:11806_t:CDS:10, partial [Gigaspora margarita]
MAERIIKRGERQETVDFDPTIGTEIRKIRPALIIFVSRHRVIALPITSNTQEVHEWQLVIKGLVKSKDGKILFDQIRFNKEETKEWIDLGLEPQETPKFAQEYLDIFYPKEKRGEVKILEIGGENLTGKLDLNDFVNLERLSCSSNKLTTLNLSNCTKLTDLDCNRNKLVNLNLSQNGELKTLYCENNNITQDLNIFSRFRNLEWLIIDNSPFYGSLAPLAQLEKLEMLEISDTDINSGVEYLPESLKTGLDVYEYDLVDYCQNKQNLSLSKIKDNLTELRKEYYKIGTEQPSAEIIKLLKDLTHDKIHTRRENDKKVVLKILNNSQDITKEFLDEISSHVLFDRLYRHFTSRSSSVSPSSGIINCYGISQDSETKNYIMVMEYMEEGNLRQYLENKIRELTLKDKLAVRILRGEKPQFNIKIPQLLEDLINHDTEFAKQLKESEEFNKTLPEEIKYPDYKSKMHAGAVYHSKLINTKEITKQLQKLQVSKPMDNVEILEDYGKTEQEKVQQLQNQLSQIKQALATLNHNITQTESSLHQKRTQQSQTPQNNLQTQISQLESQLTTYKSQKK